MSLVPATTVSARTRVSKKKPVAVLSVDHRANQTADPQAWDNRAHGVSAIDKSWLTARAYRGFSCFPADRHLFDPTDQS